MMSPLDYALSRASARFAPACADCATFAAGWARVGLGATSAPMPRLPRRRARRVMQDLARMDRMASRWAAKAGLVRKSGPAVAGDLGILEAGDGFGFALCLGLSWAAPAAVGVMFFEAEPLVVFGKSA